MHVKLTGHAHIRGVLHGPADGVFEVGEDEGAILIGNGVAEDVSADFAEEAPKKKGSAD